MENGKEAPKRKATRLKNFDYSSVCAYFITICTNDRKQILSEIVKTNLTAADKAIDLSVGEGLAPIDGNLRKISAIIHPNCHLERSRNPRSVLLTKRPRACRKARISGNGFYLPF